MRSWSYQLEEGAHPQFESGLVGNVLRQQRHSPLMAMGAGVRWHYLKLNRELCELKVDFTNGWLGDWENGMERVWKHRCLFGQSKVAVAGNQLQYGASLCG